MIAHFADEHEPTAKREVCRPCGKIAIPHVTADHDVHICRNCSDAATEIRYELVINGKTYVKSLRRLAAVSGPQKAKEPAATGSLRKRGL